MGYIVNLLSGSGFILYNRAIAQKFGVNAAIVIGYLCRLAEAFGNRFYHRQEQIAEDTGLSVYEVRGAVKKLMDSGLLKMVLVGIPARNEYTVQEDALEMFIKSTSSCENSSQQAMENLDIKTSSKTSNPISKREEYTESKTKRFIVPSVEEVKAYCVERNNYVNAQQFVDFYSAKGWVVGKAPMKDWKAAVRTWEQHDNPKPNPVPKKEVPWDYAGNR